MRIRTALALSLAALTAVAAVPADGEGPTPKICEVPAYATTLSLDGFSELVAAPDSTVGGEGSTDLYFTVDLGPDAYEDTRGSVTGELSWTIVTNDYDLAVGGAATEGYQPIDPAVETATESVTHCQLLVVSAIDFLAPAALEDLQLDLTVTRNG